LNVANVLIGNVQKEGNTIRVNASISRTKDRTQIWSDSYDEKYSNTLDLQDDISQAIAEALEVEFSEENLENIKANNPKSVEAYEYFKLGEQYHSKYSGSMNEDDSNMAERMYKEAIEADSNYAIAYAGLADFYNSYYNTHLPEMSEEEKTNYMNLQEKYIEKALDINPNLGEAYTAYAYILIAKGMFNEVFNNFKKAHKIDPGSAKTNRGLAIFLRNNGLVYSALKYDNRSVELNPLDIQSLWNRAESYRYLNELNEALLDIEKILVLEPNHKKALDEKIFILVRMKKVDELEKIIQENPDHRYYNYFDHRYYNYNKAMIYALKGQKEEAISNSVEFPLDDKAQIYSILGMKEEAINVLIDINDNNDEYYTGGYIGLKNNPNFDNIRDDPRFKTILAKEKTKYDALLKEYGEEL